MASTNCTSSKLENQIGPSVQPTPVLFSKAMGKPSQRAASTLPTTVKNLGPENWETTWGSDHVSATIFGEEQSDYRYNLSLDGEIEELQLDTYNGKTIPDAQNETPKIDEDGYPTAQDYQAYKREMAAVASYIGVGGFEMEYKITAKGYPYAVISRETNEKNGQVTELHIILNEQHERLSNREYVLQKHRFAADEAESASAEIVDFYLVDCATLEVTDEHTTQWHKANRS